MIEYVDDGDWERSVDFRRPWSISDKLFPTKYGRRSRAIVDADGYVVVFLDPSSDEYEPACTQEAAEAICRYV